MRNIDEVEKLKAIINQATEDYLDKLTTISPQNSGIYNILKILYNDAEIKELGIFLTIAEKKQIKTETLVKIIENKISKSTIYRKVHDYVESGLLIKNENNYLSLSPQLKALETIAEIHILTKNTENSL